MNYICGYISPYTIHKQDELQPRQKELKRDLPSFSVREYNQVIKRGCNIAATARLSNNVYLGENSTVGQNSTLSRSVILKNCKILPNVILENCIVLEGCEIKSNGAKYQYCKFENICNTLKVTSFKNDIIETFENFLMER